jgi:multisubunit Na+/H+ antiporter MnhB subunit
MIKLVAGILAFIGFLFGAVGLLLLAAVVSVLAQGKPLDVLSTAIAAVLIAISAFALRAAWRQWRREP